MTSDDEHRHGTTQKSAGPDLRLAGAGISTWLTSWWCLPRSAASAVFVVGVGGACVLLLLAAPRRAWTAAAALGLLGVIGGGASTGLRVWARDVSPIAVLARDHAAVTLWMVITDDPRPVSRPVSYGRAAVILRARATRVDAAGRSYALGGRVLVLASHPGWNGLLPSQHVRSIGRLSVARGADLFLAVLSARGPPTQVSQPSTIHRAAGTLRAGLRQACRSLPARERGLLPGLVIGDTSGMQPDLAEDFRTTGMTHLLAVSGTNCAIVCGAVLLLLRRVGAGSRLAAVLAGLALVGFVVLVRPSPSVLRAAVMGGLALIALAVGRSRAALPGLCAAVLVLVLFDPALAHSAGFALSVSATAGLLLLAPPWRDALRRRLPIGIAEGLAVPAAAQVACAPLIAAMSGQIGLVAVPANLLAVPAVAPATVLGVLATLLSPVWPAGAEFTVRLAGIPTRWLVVVAEHGALVPGGTVSWPGGGSGGLLLAAAVLLGLALLRVRAIRVPALCVLCLVVVVTFPIRAVTPGWPPAGWVMVVCDVGQGDALVLNAGPGTAVVVDAGPDPASVDDCLRRLRVIRVPLLVITHLHLDHVGGLSGVLRGRSVAAVALGPLREPLATWHGIQSRLESAGVGIVPTAPGELRTIAALRIQVVAPKASFRGTRSDANNSSVMLRVEVGRRVLLLAGDIEVEAQQALLAAGIDLRADVLKVAHHGSSYQDPQFLSATRPALALVSVGADNPYGHPSEQLMARLQRLGARVERTDLDGDLAVVVRGARLFVAVRGSDTRKTQGRGGASPRAPPQSRAIS